MKVFQELELQGSRPVLTKAIELISQRLDNGWIRNYEKERWLESVSKDEQYGFSCSVDTMREPADLWLLYRDDETLHVSNIIPQLRDELSVDQYNLIISEFSERFAQPVAESLGLAHTLTPATKPLEALLSKNTAAKLREFSNKSANKTSSYPNNREAWFDFLVAAHSEPKTMSSDTLAEWLIQNYWFEDAAYKLSTEYQFAHSLLTFYNEHQR